MNLSRTVSYKRRLQSKIAHFPPSFN